MDTVAILDDADSLGIDRVGVCTVEPFEETRQDLEQRKQSGLSDRLGFTFTDPERSTDIRRTFPWAERLVVGARLRSGRGRSRPGVARNRQDRPIRHRRPLSTAP